MHSNARSMASRNGRADKTLDDMENSCSMQHKSAAARFAPVQQCKQVGQRCAQAPGKRKCNVRVHSQGDELLAVVIDKLEVAGSDETLVLASCALSPD